MTGHGGADPALEPVVVRRSVRASPDRVFEAWTNPELLVKWWGPPGTVCLEANVDLRVGGGFRLVNGLPNGQEVAITGHYQAMDPPRRLRYTWLVGDAEPGDGGPSVVTVTFHATTDGTDVEIVHTNVVDPAARSSHEQGWVGCLAALAELLAA